MVLLCTLPLLYFLRTRRGPASGRVHVELE
jgi:hypothetical protein